MLFCEIMIFTHDSLYSMQDKEISKDTSYASGVFFENINHDVRKHGKFTSIVIQFDLLEI